jgi:acyl phosphate:glycerol-3-phosphate acyltransferase
MSFAALVVLGYLLGSCPWGYWLVRLVKHEDIRTVGSGNIGATNVWRTYGRWLGAPVVLLDVLKGFVPALLGMLFVSPHHLAGITAGAAAMLGHWRPLFLRFAKGGKMVATCGGVFFGVAPLVAFTAGLVWLAVFLTFRYASLASIVAGIALPVTAALYRDPGTVIVFGVGAAGAILFLHRANLRRLRAGTESRFRLRRAASA